MGMNGAQSSLFATGVYGIACKTLSVESRRALRRSPTYDEISRSKLWLASASSSSPPTAWEDAARCSGPASPSLFPCSSWGFTFASTRPSRASRYGRELVEAIIQRSVVLNTYLVDPSVRIRRHSVYLPLRGVCSRAFPSLARPLSIASPTNPEPPHSFFQFGWGPCCWIYVSEIPTARLRSLNVAIAAATQWLFNFVVARSKALLLLSWPLPQQRFPSLSRPC